MFNLYSHGYTYGRDITYNRICNKSNTKDTTCETESAYHSAASDFIPVFSAVRVARFLVFCLMLCISLLFWPLYCLSSFDVRLLITSLKSSDFSLLTLDQEVKVKMTPVSSKHVSTFGFQNIIKKIG